MRFVVLTVLLAAALLLAASAPGAVTVRTPVDDVGLPYWCDWGYDWDERCYRDAGVRLPVGGVDDKVWRSALRFSLAGLPASAGVEYARLELYFDGVCVAPRRRPGPCPPDEFAVDAHRITSSDWYHEREPEFLADVEDEALVDVGTVPHWLSWNLTALVRSWAGGEANNGVLLALAGWQEAYGVSGPYLPSMSFADPDLRPRLVVGYESPSGPAP